MTDQEQARNVAEEKARNVLKKWYPYWTEDAVNGVADALLQFHQEQESEAVRELVQALKEYPAWAKAIRSEWPEMAKKIPSLMRGLDKAAALIAKHSRKT